MHQENHQVLHYATLSLVFFTLLSGFVLSQHTFVSATDPSATATATVHVAEACTLSANNTSSHNAEMSNGTYEEGIGSTTFNVKCNDASGFALYAIGYSNEEYGNTNMIGDSTALTIPTGTEAVLGNTSSHWAMKVTKDTTSYTPANLTINNSFDSYHVVPDTYTKVATYTTGTDGVNGTGSSVIATYDARVSATQAADSYVGKVKFTLVHPAGAPKASYPLTAPEASDCPANSICYAPNYSDVEGTMISEGTTQPTLTAISAKYPTAAKQTFTTNNNGYVTAITNNTVLVTLIAPNYKRDGYGFAGWSTSFDATTETNPVIYGPNETITITAGSLSANGMILYPVWVASTGNLQDWAGCDKLTQATYDTAGNKMVATLDSVTALTDTRDGDVYAIARLADGKCWMIENLRLDNTANFADESKSQGFGGTFTGLPASSDSWTDNYTLPQLNANNTSIGGKNASGDKLVPSYNSNNTTNSQWYSYGNYYSWAAAIANTNSYNNQSVTNTSICPSGWRLPYGNACTNCIGDNPGGFYYLNSQMANDISVQGSKDWRYFPNNFIFNSGQYSGSNYYRNQGLYWTSFSKNGRDASNFIIHTSSLLLDGISNDKYPGRSVRCVTE